MDNVLINLENGVSTTPGRHSQRVVGQGCSKFRKFHLTVRDNRTIGEVIESIAAISSFLPWLSTKNSVFFSLTV